MKKYRKRFKRFVMSFSFAERRSRALKKYKQRINELENMDTDEIDFEYITLKAEYEHKKCALALLIISIALAVLMNVWNYFFLFMEKVLQYASLYEGDKTEIAKVGFVISVISAVFITCLIAFVLLICLKEMQQTQKQLMMVETVKNKRS